LLQAHLKLNGLRITEPTREVLNNARSVMPGYGKNKGKPKLLVIGSI
jgi:hypothetical protein